MSKNQQNYSNPCLGSHGRPHHQYYHSDQKHLEISIKGALCEKLEQFTHNKHFLIGHM